MMGLGCKSPIFLGWVQYIIHPHSVITVVLWQDQRELNSLTHWDRGEMDNISQTRFFKRTFFNEIFEFRLEFHWSFFPKGPIKNILA